MHIIHIEPEAPHKPPEGQPCNGCGVCCLVEPCPLGVVLFRKRSGACGALRWNAQSLQYRCGAITDPHAVAHAVLAPWASWLRPLLALVLRRGAARWVASAAGCDSGLEPVPSTASQPSANSEQARNDST